jgi:hypothetical protein
MTHDELLEKIRLKFFVNEEGATQFGPQESQLRYALLAVVELHRPDKRPTWLPVEFQGYGCFNCGGNYPCATIKAIEKELV